MTALRGQKKSNASTRRAPRRILVVVVVLLLIVAGLYAYDYMAINLWTGGDAGRLEDYPVQLIIDGEDAPPNADPKLAKIDRFLIREMRAGGRHVVGGSRSELKYNLLHTRCYVKIVIETALPGQPDRRARLKALYSLRRSGNGWQLAEPPKETTME
jgi:hypothetical protein